MLDSLFKMWFWYQLRYQPQVLANLGLSFGIGPKQIEWFWSSGLEKYIIFGCCLSLLADDALLRLTGVAESAKKVKIEKRTHSANYFTVILPSGP